MEEGTKTKKTVFVGGIGDDVDEAVLIETFSTFGDIIEVQIPPAPTNPSQPNEIKHRGFAFVTFSSSADAQDAIDNMDLNELKGRVLKVNLARHVKAPLQGAGNRAIWESEEWLQEYAKPLNRSGGATLRAQAREGFNGAEGGETADGDDKEQDGENAMQE
ncbi:RNA-binding domain-containing protein [Fomitopsis serialis]|uniref:RNA-binding domain-containing protein n=1 Tax=Fomitopsis serialis TaxID=139415 RepID=UPI00200805F5|nr:RNA-binding domain-containing protein [Neoantrodia serialis]KAH9926201.1 RNA-binding domain-containing protein [Neoantrodia serialis]